MQRPGACAIGARRASSSWQIARASCARLYQLYSSADGHGGLRAQFPPMRQRFTPEQIDLGRYLFFDRALSGDGATRVRGLPRPDRGFSDGRARSMTCVERRHAGVPLDRNAPTLWNVGFLPRLFWDGRASTLQEQAEGRCSPLMRWPTRRRRWKRLSMPVRLSAACSRARSVGSAGADSDERSTARRWLLSKARSCRSAAATTTMRSVTRRH